MIDGTAIKAIAALVNEGKRNQFVKAPNGANVYVDGEGKVDETLCVIPAMVTRAESIAGFAHQIKDRGESSDKHDNTRVFVSIDGATAITDWHEGYRRDRITMDFHTTKSFQLAQGMRMSQKDLCKAFRQNFKDMFDPDTFLTAIQNVRFIENADGEASVKPTGESMRQSVKREAAGVDSAILDGVTLSTPVLTELIGTEFLARIECTVDVDVENRVFIITPREGQIENAKAQAVAAIASYIREGNDSVTVFENAVFVS